MRDGCRDARQGTLDDRYDAAGDGCRSIARGLRFVDRGPAHCRSRARGLNARHMLTTHPLGGGSAQRCIFLGPAAPIPVRRQLTIA
jgi:hypothetical protein